MADSILSRKPSASDDDYAKLIAVVVLGIVVLYLLCGGIRTLRFYSQAGDYCEENLVCTGGEFTQDLLWEDRLVVECECVIKNDNSPHLLRISTEVFEKPEREELS